MECSIAALLTSACLSWSNLYVESHISAIDSPAVSYRFDGQNWTASNDYQNPYAGFGIGLELPFRNISVSLEASHMLSSLSNSNDKGINAISIQAQWHPFRR